MLSLLYYSVISLNYINYYTLLIIIIKSNYLLIQQVHVDISFFSLNFFKCFFIKMEYSRISSCYVSCSSNAYSVYEHIRQTQCQRNLLSNLNLKKGEYIG